MRPPNIELSDQTIAARYVTPGWKFRSRIRFLSLKALGPQCRNALSACTLWSIYACSFLPFGVSMCWLIICLHSYYSIVYTNVWTYITFCYASRGISTVATWWLEAALRSRIWAGWLQNGWRVFLFIYLFYNKNSGTLDCE